MVPRIFARSNATHKYHAGYQAHDQRRAFLLAIVYTSGHIHGELLRMRIAQMGRAESRPVSGRGKSSKLMSRRLRPFRHNTILRTHFAAQHATQQTSKCVLFSMRL